MRSPADEQARPEKRQRLVEEGAGDGHTPEAAAAAAAAADAPRDSVQQQQEQHGEADGAPPPGPPPAAQLSQALARIANHISSAAKFPKASQLLRQVLDAADKAHRSGARRLGGGCCLAPVSAARPIHHTMRPATYPHHTPYTHHTHTQTETSSSRPSRPPSRTLRTPQTRCCARTMRGS
jgi:hypothetical protein